MNEKIVTLVLAAGKGSRMKSDMPKVLHQVNGKPMLHTVIEAAFAAGSSQIVLVVGHQQSLVRESTAGFNQVAYAEQTEQLGTGHAVLVSEAVLEKLEAKTVMVLPGDSPLIDAGTLQKLIDYHVEKQAVATVLTAQLDEPASYGRILRDEEGAFKAIREAKDCTNEQLQITEINSGMYCFESRYLFDALRQLNTENKQHEYYLTDVCAILKQAGHRVEGVVADDPNTIVGVNSKEELKKLSQ